MSIELFSTQQLSLATTAVPYLSKMIYSVTDHIFVFKDKLCKLFLYYLCEYLSTRRMRLDIRGNRMDKILNGLEKACKQEERSES